MAVSLPVLTEDVHKYAPWSHSKCGVATNCTAQFSKKYIEKIPEIDVYEESKVGTALHAVIEIFLNGDDFARLVELRRDFTIKRSAVVEVFDVVTTTGKTALTETERETAAEHLDNIVRFLEWVRRFVLRFDVVRFMVEYKFAFTADFKPVEFFDKKGLYRGVVDFAMVTRTNHLIVIDHKSSARMKPIEAHAEQLRSYALLGDVKLPGLKGIQSAIHYTLHGSAAGPQLVWGPKTNLGEVREIFRPWLFEHLNNSVKPLKEIKTTTGWWCNWCGYRSICEDGKTRDRKNRKSRG